MPTEFQQALDELRRRHPEAAPGLVDLMRQFAGQRVTIPDPQRAERIAEAVRLKDKGLARADICRRLVHRFKLSPRTARRDISEALDARRPELGRV